MFLSNIENCGTFSLNILKNFRQNVFEYKNNKIERNFSKFSSRLEKKYIFGGKLSQIPKIKKENFQNENIE